ncbi:MAG TPA: hypothetical protein VJ044_00100, partial [Candidatus Hodarchaeales archaeon]|nr:hypothetical protein [Candidatus Hodarchaeales archaeon]
DILSGREFLISYQAEMNVVRLGIVCLVAFVFWELQPHKERRFFLTTEYLFLAVSAVSVFYIARIASSYTNNVLIMISNYSGLLGRGRLKSKSLIIASMVVLILVPYFFFSERDSRIIDSNSSTGILAGQRYVGQLDNVTGVIIIGRYWFDGGFTFLHKNVSMVYVPDPTGNHYYFTSSLSYNYAVVPHGKYLEFPNLATMLADNYWVKVSELQEATDIWAKGLESLPLSNCIRFLEPFKSQPCYLSGQ